MSQFELLTVLQQQYPSTTAAAHDLVMRASDLKRARTHENWVDFQGLNKAQVAFNNALWETLLWAARESREECPDRLLKFAANFFAQFALACPRWNSVWPVITVYLLEAITKDVSILNDAIAQVKSEQSIVRGIGRGGNDQSLQTRVTVYPLSNSGPH